MQVVVAGGGEGGLATALALAGRATASRIDVSPMITAEVGLDQVGWAFEALARPDEQCKILVRP